ncbi:MAG: Hsp20/alpha crystallin family protein [Clostridiaceae bacterium]|nr:Hsp20/alpha crystallin family protein [Clostridiaceae bacterium]
MFGLIPYRDRRNVSVYNPFRELEEMERLFFRDSIGEFKTDISEDEKSYTLEADLPGFKKEDIHVDINDDSLIISAERKSESEEKDQAGNYIRRERSFGSFSRSFDISGVKPEEIKASFANGVLTLTMPKKESSLPTAHRLEIE